MPEGKPGVRRGSGYEPVTAMINRPASLLKGTSRSMAVHRRIRGHWDARLTLDLREGVTPPNQVNDSKKGSNGPAGSRSGKLHSERLGGVGSGSVTTMSRCLWPLEDVLNFEAWSPVLPEIKEKAGI